MAGLINWKKQAIPSENPDSSHVYAGIDSADDMLYTKDDLGNVTKFPTLSQIGGAVLTTALSGISFVIATPIVSTDTIIQAFGKLQAQINNINNSIYKASVSTTTGFINNTNVYSQFLNLNAVIPVNGVYKLSWSYTWSTNNATKDFMGRVQQDNTTTLMEHKQEVKDSAGTGIVLSLVGGGTANSGTDQRNLASGHVILNLNAGTYNFDLDWSGSTNGMLATIYQGAMSIERFE